MAKKKRRGNNNWMVFVVIGGVLMIGAALVLVLANNAAPSNNAAGNPSGVDPVAAVPRISLEASKEAFDQGEAVFLDVRTPAEYERMHIPGAVLIPYTDLQSRLGELDPAATYITYCT
jgi:3-mercaptopyruvate sulfurtransferase SseA